MAVILHVDDDPVWRMNVQRALGHDHEVHSAGSIEDAIELLGPVAQCQYSVVIVDRDLVGGGDHLGEDLLDYLRSGTYLARVIVMTGSLPSGPLMERFQQRLGVDEIIFKGNDGPLELRGTVERALSRLTTPAVRSARQAASMWLRRRGEDVDELVGRYAVFDGNPPRVDRIVARFYSWQRRIEGLSLRARDDDEAEKLQAAVRAAEAEISRLLSP